MNERSDQPQICNCHACVRCVEHWKDRWEYSARRAVRQKELADQLKYKNFQLRMRISDLERELGASHAS